MLSGIWGLWPKACSVTKVSISYVRWCPCFYMCNSFYNGILDNSLKLYLSVANFWKMWRFFPNYMDLNIWLVQLTDWNRNCKYLIQRQIWIHRKFQDNLESDVLEALKTFWTMLWPDARVHSIMFQLCWW